jgi:hypothetical protein
LNIITTTMVSSVKKWIGRFYKTKEWREIEYFDESWKKRIHQMSKYITPTDSIVDYGCGKMWLKEFIAPSNAYYGVDYQKREEGTIVCDFNKKEFPGIRTSVSFISGCLEYIDKPSWFIKNIALYHEKCIISYCCNDNFNNIVERKQLGWKNNLSKKDLIALFEKEGLYLKSNEATPTVNQIFYFEKHS